MKVEFGSIGNKLSWNATDVFPDIYSTYANGLMITENQSWDNSSKETINIDGLNLGVYNYSIVYIDYFGNEKSNYVIVTVEDTTPPLIEYLGSYIFDSTITGNVAIWNTTDLLPDHAEIFVDNALLTSVFWDNTNLIVQNLDFVSDGEHILTLKAYDKSENFEVLSINLKIIGDELQNTQTTTITKTETIEVTNTIETVITSEVITTKEIVQTIQKSEAGLSYQYIVMMSSLIIIVQLIRKRRNLN